MASQDDSKWYDNKIIVVLAVIFILPLGLYALYKTNVFNSTSKAALVVLGALVLIISIGYNSSIEKALTHLEAEDSYQGSNLLTYEVISNETYDKPIKAQVDLKVALSPSDQTITKSKIERLLRELYSQQRNRTGFTYYDKPTNIFIYVFASVEDYEKGPTNWLGMVDSAFGEDKDKPNYRFKNDLPL